MISDIMKGIKTKYTGSALAGVLTGGIHDTQAPEGTAYPYATVQVISNMNHATFTESMEFFRLQFNIITDELNKSKATTGLNALETALRALFDYTTLTISGWTATPMVWNKSDAIFSFSTKVIGVMVEYEVYIYKSN